MKPNSSVRYLLAFGLLITLSIVALKTAASQSKVLYKHRINSCDEVRGLYPELESLSRDALRESLYSKFCDDCTRSAAEAYTYAKYYVCRFPDDDSDFGRYVKEYVAAYERAVTKQDSK